MLRNYHGNKREVSNRAPSYLVRWGGGHLRAYDFANL